MASLIAELRRRKVFRVAAVYAVVAWLLIQVADVVLPTFGAPGWANQTLIFLFIIGFPVAVVLAWAYESTPEGVRPDHVVEASPGKQATAAQPINYIILLVVIIVAGVQVSERWFAGEESVQSTPLAAPMSGALSTRTQIDLGASLPAPGPSTGPSTYLEFSPDGESFLYLTGGSDNGWCAVMRRSLNRLESETLFEFDSRIHGTKISPDGNWIAFRHTSQYTLGVINSNGGAIRNLANPVPPTGFAWLDANTLIYTNGGAVLTRSLTEEEPVQIAPNREGRVFQSFFPLPGTHHVLAALRPSDSTENSIIVLNLNSGESLPLLSNAYRPWYSPSGHLLFSRDNNLWAVAFDPEELQLTGSEQLMVAGIESVSTGPGEAIYALSARGQLLYIPGANLSSGDRTLVWIGRDGNERPLDLPVARYQDPVISPDGQRLAVAIYTGSQPDIWTHDFGQAGILNRITNTGASDPLWTPDGRYLVYRQLGFGDFETGQGLGRIDADGIGALENFLDASEDLYPRAFTPEGDLLYVAGARSTRQSDIYRYDTSNPDSPGQALLSNSYLETSPSVSPDGHWLAYTSDETGRDEIYVRPYPDLDSGKWRVSLDGGRGAKWGRDPAVLHFTSDGYSTLNTVRLQLEPRFEVLERQAMDVGISGFSGLPNYAVGQSDDEFLILREANEESAEDAADNIASSRLAVLVDNFFAELNQKAPPNPQ